MKRNHWLTRWFLRHLEDYILERQVDRINEGKRPYTDDELNQLRQDAKEHFRFA